MAKALKVLLITLMFMASASAKKKVNLADYPLTAHVLMHDHASMVSRVDATIDGTTYVLEGTNIMHGNNRCRATALDATITLEAGMDYPARRVQRDGSEWFQFVIPDEQHPLCNLRVVGVKKKETQQ